MGKKIFFTAAAFVVCVFLFAQAGRGIAQMKDESPVKKEGMNQAMAPHAGMMGGGKCPYLAEKGAEGEGMADMRQMMGKGKEGCPLAEGDDAAMGPGMMGKGKKRGMMGGGCSIVSTSGGGVIVLCGRDLYKYDRNLNLIKKVKIGE